MKSFALNAGFALALASSLAPSSVQAPQGGGLGVRLRDVAAASGVRFVHQHSPTPGKYFVESAPGGLAVFDYNDDRRPDIFFTNGAQTPSLEKTSATYANRLYRNDGDVRFTDVTDAAGVRGVGYAMGAAAADYDNDGHVDLSRAPSPTTYGPQKTQRRRESLGSWSALFLFRACGRHAQMPSMTHRPVRNARIL